MNITCREIQSQNELPKAPYPELEKRMKGLPSLRSLAALLSTFLSVFSVVFAGCDINSLQNCAHQLANYERQVSGGFISYAKSELEDLCRRFDDIRVCVKRATSTCPSESMPPSSASASSSFPSTDVAVDGQFLSASAYKKKLWSGLESSFTFLCKYGKDTYLKYLQCFSQQPLQSGIRHCNRTYHMNKASAHSVERTCQVTNEFLQCLRSAVNRQCGEEASNWEVRVVQKLRQPNMEAFGCTLGSCSFRVNRLILTASLLLSVVKSSRQFSFRINL